MLSIPALAARGAPGFSQQRLRSLTPLRRAQRLVWPPPLQVLCLCPGPIGAFEALSVMVTVSSMPIPSGDSEVLEWRLWLDTHSEPLSGREVLRLSVAIPLPKPGPAALLSFCTAHTRGRGEGPASTRQTAFAVCPRCLKWTTHFFTPVIAGLWLSQYCS